MMDKQVSKLLLTALGGLALSLCLCLPCLGQGRLKTQFPPAPTPPFAADEENSEQSQGEPKHGFGMGTTDHMRSGKDEDGDSVMEIKSRPPSQEQLQQQQMQQQMQQQGLQPWPIIVAPQINPQNQVQQGQHGQQGQSGPQTRQGAGAQAFPPNQQSSPAVRGR